VKVNVKLKNCAGIIVKERRDALFFCVHLCSLIFWFWIQKEKLLSLKVKQPAAMNENTICKIVFRKETALLLLFLHDFWRNRKSLK
jgi:hypothetical protein